VSLKTQAPNGFWLFDSATGHYFFNHKPILKMENSVVYFNGQEFANEQALHEWRLIFEFEYFLEQAEQN